MDVVVMLGVAVGGQHDREIAARPARQMAQELALQMLPGRDNPIDALSAREFEVFRLLVAGHSLQEISRILCLSYKTVANYQSNMKHKLDVSNTAQVVRIALSHGLIAGAAEAEENRSESG